VRILLDTHALLWALEDSVQLSELARRTIVDLDNQVLVSAVSAIEIAIKRSLNKLEAPDDLLGAVEAAGFIPITIDFATATRLGSLPPHHRDPFDRLLVAQALTEDVPMVTRDPSIRAYGIRTIW
jgi:PIN domain nuclease of toxin-antitoxin system